MKVFILLIFLAPLSNQEGNTEHRKEILRNFTTELSTQPLNKNKIRKKYIYPINGERRDERIELLNEILISFNKDLGTKDISKLDFMPFSELSKSEQNRYSAREVRDIFAVKYEGEYYFSILFENDMIRSLITLKKGELRNFLLL